MKAVTTVAKVIEFYIPNNFRKSVKYVSCGSPKLDRLVGERKPRRQNSYNSRTKGSSQRSTNIEWY